MFNFHIHVYRAAAVAKFFLYPLRYLIIVLCAPREYELMTEAHAKLSVVRNCSKSYLCVSVGGEYSWRGGEVSSSRGWGEADSTQGDRIWSSLV
jgi:hypothetical protein